MTTEFDRKRQWRPASRPEWVARVNEMGRCMDLKKVVPLDEKSLIKAAEESTGLSDFGNENWYEPFQIFTKALDDESELNLTGRLLTRTDLLVYLEARLQIEATYKLHPEIHDEEIIKPLYIVGQGRSGTTLLQNILSADPGNGTTLTWELMFPCPPPEKDTYTTDPRIQKAEAITNLTSLVTPELTSMHDFSATAATECIQLHSLLFQSPWLMAFGGQSPTYAQYLQQQNPLQLYEYEKKILKLLQWRNPRKHWIMKSPICLMHMPQIMEVFPDVGFIWPHRDPVRALSSSVSLLGTMMWGRSDRTFIGNALDNLTNANVNAMVLNQPIQWLETGTLSESDLCNIQYTELVKDPMRTVEYIYQYFDIAFSDGAKEHMQKYVNESASENRKTHHYSTGDAEQIDVERHAYRTYQNHFNVPNEIKYSH
ncbi:MAG: sulfotransferase [Halieaceae bacterium]|nr:sulfotransferase [Halieaceae bacterium]